MKVRIEFLSIREDPIEYTRVRNVGLDGDFLVLYDEEGFLACYRAENIKSVERVEE